MNLLMVERARELYLSRLEENNKNKELLKEFNKLRNNKYVKRYLELVNMGELLVCDDIDIIRNVFKDKDISNKINSNIFVFYGAYKNGRRVNYDFETLGYREDVVDYFVYINIINNKVIYLKSYDESELFRIKNNVIEIGLSNYDEFKFYILQDDLYKRLLDGYDTILLLEYLESVKDVYNIKNINRVVNQRRDRKVLGRR